MWFLVDRQGRPLRMRRYVFSEAFAAIAYAAVSSATGDPELRGAAVEAFETYLRHSFEPGLMPPKDEPTRPSKGIAGLMIGIVTAQELRENLGDLKVAGRGLDDWIEGYLLNCFRGHPNHDPVPFTSNFPEFNVIHPFLPSSKKDFSEFLLRNDWMRWVVEDETNQVVRGSRRNWIRRSILPEMTRQRLSLEKFAKRRIKRMMESIS